MNFVTFPSYQGIGIGIGIGVEFEFFGSVGACLDNVNQENFWAVLRTLIHVG